MRRTIFLALMLGTGCASMMNARPTTVFAPLPDEDAHAGEHGQGLVTVLEHQIQSHPTCYPVQRQNGAGIVRCDYGKLEWVLTEDIAQGVDDYDLLKDAMKNDAAKDGSALEDKEVKCNMGGAPASCHTYVFTPKDGSTSHTTIVGMAGLTGRALVAQCVAVANQNNAMQPVCAEVFDLK